jgi:diguanylate cyclase (GGDEF)-like protein
MVGRYGGEEFVAQIPGRPASAALAIAEEIRTEIATSPFTFDSRQAPCTTSIGVAELVEGETPEQLVRRADQALYEAKHAGRDRTVVWTPPTA